MSHYTHCLYFGMLHFPGWAPASALPRCPSVGTSVVPLVQLVRSLASASQPILLALADNQTWLRDSVRQASPQVKLSPFYLGGRQRSPCTARRDHGPTGEGCNGACPSSCDELRGFTAFTLSYLRKAEGYSRSWICES